jgi:hypothetical protein
MDVTVPEAHGYNQAAAVDFGRAARDFGGGSPHGKDVTVVR